MTERNPLRVGKISSYDKSKETACVVYADRDNTSADLPFLASGYWMPKVNDTVLVGNLSSGSGSAVILGPIGKLPDDRLMTDDLQEQMSKLNERVSALEGG